MNIKIEELVNNIDDYILIDVRSPREYNEGTIYNAINIPILDDESRHIVGLLYKEDKEKAYREGLNIGTKLLPIFYDKISELKKDNPSKKIVIFCFRGGTRSSSVVNVMNMLKLDCLKLDGGYKGYRTYILDKIDEMVEEFSFLVLTGNTGSGKTQILNSLTLPLIDLEGMAGHRGSIFGGIGLHKVNQKVFEDRLFFELFKNKNNKYLFIESESRKIADISLPNSLFNKMNSGAHILINVSVEKRVEILMSEYDVSNIDIEIVKSLIINNEYFKVLMGGEWVLLMIDYLDNRNFEPFIKHMLVDYYDKLYAKSHQRYNYTLTIENDSFSFIKDKLTDYYNGLLHF